LTQSSAPASIENSSADLQQDGRIHGKMPAAIFVRRESALIAATLRFVRNNSVAPPAYVTLLIAAVGLDHG